VPALLRRRVALLLLALFALSGLVLPAIGLADGRAILSDFEDNGQIDECYTRAEFQQALRLARADERVYAGDVVRYRLTFTNPQRNAVQGIVLNNPIPAGMQFVAGSSSASRDDIRVEYSADGGKNFSTQPTEEVTIEGRKVRRPVASERYTHVRWTVGGTVAPGAAVTAEYDARLPAGARSSTAASSAARPSGN
jgi:uncharacterized repeat protein (TIGR01451 family)